MSTREETISSENFARLRALIYEESGIALTIDKRTMVEIRLKRRMRSLGIDSFGEYCERLFTPEGRERELVQLIDVITTNKTDFFREAGHFEYLTAKALPELASRQGVNRKCLAWSAGCSSGEEPYTLAMVLNEYAGQSPGFRFGILASDICTEVLSKAAMGIFKTDVVKPVPADLRRKYFMRSRDPESELMRVVPELRAAVEFRRINFMDDFSLAEPVEILFCRNVIIYFDRPTQIRILKKLHRQLAPGGYFFAGHSESLQGMDLPLVPVGPSVYRRR